MNTARNTLPLTSVARPNKEKARQGGEQGPEPRSECNAGGWEREGGRQGVAQRIGGRIEAAIKEDEEECDGPKAGGEMVIVERDPAEAFGAADDPEHEQQQHD